MNLKSLTDQQLLRNMEIVAEKERRVLFEIICYFAEIERRKLFAITHSSMFEFATRELKMSEGSAQRRIDAARVFNELPEMAEKIKSGELNLMHFTVARKYFRREKKAGRVLTKDDKLGLFKELEGKSTRQAEKLIASRTGEERLHTLCLKLTSEERELFERVRDLWAHRFPDGDASEIFVAMMKLTLEKIDPLQKAERAAERKAKKAAKAATAGGEFACDVLESGEVQYRLPDEEERSRYVTAEVAHEAWRRSGLRCEYIAPDGSRCTSMHALEHEHKIPFALGGDNSINNIRILCRTHNQLLSREMFGAKWMARKVEKAQAKNLVTRYLVP